jgi:hypothetical protein
MFHVKHIKTYYFPTQKLENISPNKSSATNSPVISDIALCAALSSSAQNSIVAIFDRAAPT